MIEGHPASVGPAGKYAATSSREIRGAVRYHSVIEGDDHRGWHRCFQASSWEQTARSTATEAVALAVRLARQNSAKLHLVIGVHSPAAVSVPAGAANVSDPSGGANLRQAAQSMLESVAEGVEGLDVEIHTDVGTQPT